MWSLNFNIQGLQVGGGLIQARQLSTHTEEEPAGLKLIVLYQGDVAYQTDQGPTRYLSDMSYHLAFHAQAMHVQHDYAPHKNIEFLSIRLPLQGNEALFDSDFLPKTAKSEPVLTAFDKPLNALLCQQSMQLRPQNEVSSWALPAMALMFMDSCLQEHRQTALPMLPALTLKQVQCAADILDEHLQNPPTLRELAATTGLNVNKLSWAFQQHFQQSIHAYLLEKRMLLARKLLSQTAFSIGEIAYQIGYTESHFSKVCKQYFGYTPKHLRK